MNMAGFYDESISNVLIAYKKNMFTLLGKPGYEK